MEPQEITLTVAEASKIEGAINWLALVVSVEGTTAERRTARDIKHRVKQAFLDAYSANKAK